MRDLLRHPAAREALLTLTQVIAALTVANIVYGSDIIYLFAPIMDVALGALQQSYIYGPLAAVVFGALAWLQRRDASAHAGFAAAASIVAALPPIMRWLALETTKLAQERFSFIEPAPAGQSPWAIAPLVFIGFMLLPTVVSWKRERYRADLLRASGVGLALTLLGVLAFELLALLAMRLLIAPQLG